jgi:hypothetical protein
MAIRRSPNFRFDYFLRSLPIDQVGRRCEQLMSAAEKEVEQLEKKVREDVGIVVEEGSTDPLPPIEIPKFKVLRARWRNKEQEEAEKQRIELEGKVEVIEEQMREAQERMKTLNQFTREANNSMTTVSAEFSEELVGELANLVAQSGSLGIVGVANKFLEEKPGSSISRRKVVAKIEEIAIKEKREDMGDTHMSWYIRPKYTNLLDVDTLKYLRQTKDEKLEKMEESKEAKKKADEPSQATGAPGPDGNVLDFPEYDGEEEPKNNKKAFTLFCNSVRKEVKAALPLEKRKNKEIVHRILRERWSRLPEDEQVYWRKMEQWDEKRFARDSAVFEKKKSGKKGAKAAAAKKRAREENAGESSGLSVPKKRKSKSVG